MSEKLILYYSVQNQGDGSAYPKLFDTEALAAWHEEHEDEGFCESTGTITVEGADLSCPDLITKEEYYLELLLDGYGLKAIEELAEFTAAFFPDGLPTFSVEIIEPKYYGVFFEGHLVHQAFAYPEKKANKKGVAKLLKRIAEQKVDNG